MYAKTGRPSIPPEKLLRAQLIQMLYSVRSDRLQRSYETPLRRAPDHPTRRLAAAQLDARPTLIQNLQSSGRA
jgi:hypothetical protein